MLAIEENSNFYALIIFSPTKDDLVSNRRSYKSVVTLSQTIQSNQRVINAGCSFNI